jgi:hypothetical protein
MGASAYLDFHNTDSVTHTVVFANGRCTVSVPPGYDLGPGNDIVYPGQQSVPLTDCGDNFPFYVGSYGYTVDGKFTGTVETVPLRRFVTLTARTHHLRRGRRLTLRGKVTWGTQEGVLTDAPFPVIVLARYTPGRPFEPVASVAVKRGASGFSWEVKVRPGVTTTYIAEVTGQLPKGQVWTQARSRSFTVRFGHHG